jgi:uncharacterized membrane protein YjfL (UPF0719 family)
MSKEALYKHLTEKQKVLFILGFIIFLSTFIPLYYLPDNLTHYPGVLLIDGIAIGFTFGGILIGYSIGFKRSPQPRKGED